MILKLHTQISQTFICIILSVVPLFGNLTRIVNASILSMIQGYHELENNIGKRFANNLGLSVRIYKSFTFLKTFSEITK